MHHFFNVIFCSFQGASAHLGPGGSDLLLRHWQLIAYEITVHCNSSCSSEFRGTSRRWKRAHICREYERFMSWSAKSKNNNKNKRGRVDWGRVQTTTPGSAEYDPRSAGHDPRSAGHIRARQVNSIAFGQGDRATFGQDNTQHSGNKTAQHSGTKTVPHSGTACPNCLNKPLFGLLFGKNDPLIRANCSVFGHHYSGKCAPYSGI